MSSGESAWKSGLKPLKSTVRSRAGDVRSTGILSPSSSASASPTSWVSEM